MPMQVRINPDLRDEIEKQVRTGGRSQEDHDCLWLTTAVR